MGVQDSTSVPVCDLVRVSQDRSRREKSPDEQHAAHQRSAERMGWTLVGLSYRDIGSASKHAKKERAGFNRLIDDLRKGTFPGEYLMMWENSRGSRKESEWLELIELAELRGVKFWIEVRERVMDPHDPHDRRDLVHAAADAAFETGLMSKRIRKGTRGAAQAGLPHGQTPYGYRRLYDPHTKLFVAQEEHPEEAPVIRELFAGVNAGKSIYSIWRDFEKRGIEKRSGGPFSQTHLRSLLTSIAYAGLRVHNTDPELSRPVANRTAPRTEAVWPALVSLEDWNKAQRILESPERKEWKHGKARHFLSHIARCGKCGSPLSCLRDRVNVWIYRCSAPSGCVRIVEKDLDLWTEKLLLKWLSDPEQYAVLLRSGEEQDVKLTAVRAELDEAIGERDDLSARVAAREPGFTVAFAAPIAASLEQRITQLQAREKELASSDLDGLIEPGPDVAARWETLGMDTKRLIARRLLVPRYIGELRVKQVGRGHRNVPVKDRVFFGR